MSVAALVRPRGAAAARLLTRAALGAAVDDKRAAVDVRLLKGSFDNEAGEGVGAGAGIGAGVRAWTRAPSRRSSKSHS